MRCPSRSVSGRRKVLAPRPACRRVRALAEEHQEVVMQFRDLWEKEDPPAPQAPAGTPGEGADLAALRQAGDRLLAAGDEAIDRALSGDSERFLAANRQQGGQ